MTLDAVLSWLPILNVLLFPVLGYLVKLEKKFAAIDAAIASHSALDDEIHAGLRRDLNRLEAARE